MTTEIRTLIVDDEPLARERVRTLLEADPEVEVVGECEDGRGAVEEILRHSPDLVFLDVQMPEMDGFEVVEALGDHRLPIVVFVTAYDQYALRAFEVHAVDYLLKPFDRARFAQTVAWVKQRIRGDGKGPDREIRALLEEVRKGRPESQRIVIRSRGRIRFVAIDDIEWVESAGNYVRIHTAESSHLLRETMKAMETRLGSAFARVSRSAIVRVDRIREMSVVAHGEYVLSLAGGDRVRSGRTYSGVLTRLMGQSDEGSETAPGADPLRR